MWGVIEPGFASTWPRSTSSRLIPRSRRADVVSRLTLIEELLEHLDAGDDGLRDLGVDPDHLDLVADLDDALLDAAGDDRPATRDREDVLDREQERLVDLADGLGNVAVDRLHELEDLRRPLGVALERLERRDTDNRDLVAGELVPRQELADLELDELEQLLDRRPCRPC